MRKIFGIAGLAAVALFAFAQSGKDLLSGFSQTLNKADTLSVAYTVQPVGGAPQNYAVDLMKPNRLRIERPNELIVADGKTVTTYNKVAKTYFKRAQTGADLGQLLAEDDVNLWNSFFQADALAKVASTKSLGNKNRKGQTLAAVEATMDKNGRRVVTFYLDQAKLARQAEIVNNNPDGKLSWIIDAKTISVGTGASDSAADEAKYAFTPPDGSREMTLAEMNSAKWYEDLEEAKKVAKETKRLLMVDFSAVW